MEHISNMEYLSLLDIMKILKKKIIFITFITIVCTAVMAAKVIYLTTPMYEAHASAIIVKGDTSIVQNQQYTQGDIMLYEKVVDTYAKIAETDLVIDKTAEELKTYRPSQIKGMVMAVPSAAQSGETQIIELSARAGNKEDAANIANTYCHNFINESMRILPVGKIQVLDAAKVPAGPIAEKKVSNIAIGFLFGLFLSAGIVLFKHYVDSLKIRNEKQIRNLLNIPVIITIE